MNLEIDLKQKKKKKKKKKKKVPWAVPDGVFRAVQKRKRDHEIRRQKPKSLKHRCNKNK